MSYQSFLFGVAVGAAVWHFAGPRILDMVKAVLKKKDPNA